MVPQGARPETMILTTVTSLLLAAFLVLWFGFLRPRRGGKDAPPLVLDSPAYPIPFLGLLMEFFKSPHTMMKRCYSEYGSIFTIPVRRVCAECG
jgi:hypothetical protein